MRLLDHINSPADVKALREDQLPQLAQEIRDELINVLSEKNPRRFQREHSRTSLVCSRASWLPGCL